jgi:hypothetical protein
MKKKSVRRRAATSKVVPAAANDLGDWQDAMTSRLRRVIHAADPAAVEEQKWKKPSNPAGVPVWYDHGIVCTVGSLKNRVRLTFGNGALLKDPKHLFNACLDAGYMRGIDFYEGDPVDEEGIKSLVRAAVALNTSTAQR